MYRDVKKKLLSVALCICVIMGTVEVVPRVKAAVNKEISVTGTYGAGETTATFKFKLQSDTLTYNGTAQLPSIVPGSVSCSNDDFNGTLEIAGTGATNASDNSYYCGLASTSGWNFPENCIPYKIQKATLSNLRAEMKDGKYVQYYTGQNVVPKPEDILVKAKINNVDTIIQPGQYTVSGGQTKSGQATCSITIKDDNYEGTLTKGDIEYVIAYDLGGKLGYTASIDKTEINDFGNNMTLPIVTLSGDGKTSIIVNEHVDKFDMKYYKDGVESSVNSVGTYTLKVTPSGNAECCMYDNDIYFAGEYVQTIQVKALTAEDLVVVATDPQTDQQITIYDKKNPGNVKPLIVKYQDGTLTPPDVIVQGKLIDGTIGDIAKKCTISAYLDTNSPGQAKLEIEPITAETNYSGKITITYFIKSDIEISSFRFKDQKEGVSDIVYDGKDHILDQCVVKNQDNQTLNNNLDYKIVYEYWNGSSYQEADAEKRKTVGKKRIHIVGIGTYDKKDCYQEYTIKAVDITEGKGYSQNVEIVYTDDPYYYTGKEIKPKFKMLYNGIEVGTSENTNGQFTFKYLGDHTNANECKLEITGSNVNYTGTYYSTYVIKAIDFSNAVVTPHYTYSGSSIIPEIKIQTDENHTYVLNGNPAITDYVVLDYDGDELLKNKPPKNRGNHTVKIKVLNTQNISCVGVGTEKQFDYTIDPKEIGDLQIYLDPRDVNSQNQIQWNGGETKPRVVVPDGLTENVDYKVLYSDCGTVTDAAIATVIAIEEDVEGNLVGNYTGSKKLTYEITRRALSDTSGEFTYNVKPSTNTTPNYTLTLELKDKNRNPVDQLLTIGVDYEVKTVERYDDVNDIWKFLTKDSEYSIVGNQVTGLTRAGKYRVEISGIGKYAGELKNENNPVICGKDISAYIPQIKGAPLRYVYDGNEHKPAMIDLYKDVDTQDEEINASCYDISYVRAKNKGNQTDVGRVYVIVTGKPEEGYFGKTARLDIEGAYYEIVAPVWSAVNPLTVKVVTGTGIMYNPSGTPEPPVVVSYQAISLTENKDYTVEYIGSQTAGKNKEIIITGIGNYAGNLWKEYYDVLPVDISREKGLIHELTYGADYGKGETSFKLEYGNYPLVAGRDRDYSFAPDLTSGSAIYWNDALKTYQTTYIVEGQNNFTGKRIITINVNKSNLDPSSGTEFAKDEKSAQPGQYYVVWSLEEMNVNQPEKDLEERAKIKPEKFTVYYKTETGSILLKRGTDYNVLNEDKYYGTNATPGWSKNNYLTIEGNGGYTGKAELYFTLYTDISKAKLAPVSTLQETPKAITKSAWKEAYNKAKEEDKSYGLVKLENLYVKEGDFIDSREYKLSWPADLNLADPAVGTYTMSIVGNPIELKEGVSHYYRGNRNVTFTIVNGIEDAEIQVNSNNCVQYTGQPMTVTGAATTFIVKVDGVTLERGRDYEIIGYENNDKIGEAVVKIRGIGNYQGEAQGKFFITYPLAKLGVQMLNEEGNWVDVTNASSVILKYNHEAKTPSVRLYIKEFDPNAAQAFTELGGYFETEYLNNEGAGTANVRIKNCTYFTSDAGYREVPFTILKNSILPTTVTGGAVTYSPIEAVNGNLSVTYTGKEIDAEEDLNLVLSDHGYPLVKDTDYVIFYRNNNQDVSVAGSEPQIDIKGIGNYEDVYTFSYKIMPKDINDGITAEPIEVTYTGGTIEEAVKNQLAVIQDDIKKTLKCDTDFEIENYYLDEFGHSLVTGENGIPNTKGKYYAKLKGINNYTGSRFVQITVGQKDMSEGMRITFVSNEHCTISPAGEPQCIYDGTDHEPTVVVSYGSNVTLEKDKDYSVSYSENRNVGTATVTVTGIGNYTGTTFRTFKINPKNIAKLDTDANTMWYTGLQENYPFTGVSVEPVFSVNDSETGETLVRDVDYKVDYLSEYDAEERETGDDTKLHSYGGKVTMTVVGQNNYTGTQEFVYYIGEDISKSYTVLRGETSTTYNGLMQAPNESNIEVVWMADAAETDVNQEKRYDIAYFKDGFEAENRVNRDQIVNAGTYYIAVIGVPSKGTYAKSSVENSCVYTINPRSIAPSYILVSGYDGTYYYTGQQIQPKGIAVEDTDLPVNSDVTDPQRRSVKLTNGTDYDLNYTNNVSAGKASIIVTGKGNYTGSRVAYFNIISSNADGNNTWDGSSEGTGSISDGSTTIAAGDIILGFDNSTYDCMMYNGYERIPTVNIAGISNSEFIITASNNIRPGVATLTITGRGNNFTGTIIKNYKIKADLSTYGRIATIEDQVYTGYQITPHVTLTCGGNLLNQGSDYTVTYLNNTNVGKATVMATAAGNSYYIGTATGTFNISNTAVGMEITGYASSYTYTGYAITPDVVVTMNGRVLNRGTDYVVSYSNNTNVGTATMTVTGIGSFSGTKTINYTIEAKNIENCLTTAVTNYQYTGNTYTPNVTVTDSSTGKTLVAGTDYTITYSNNTNPGTASITVTALSKNYTGSKVIPFKITSAAVSGLRTSTIKNNRIKLAWSAQDYADGYQICNSNNRVVATTANNSYTVKGLSSCTTYKFKVRSYVENADGSVSYGNFSTAVSAKTLLNTPTLTAKSTSKGKVTLTWTKVAKATGYEIYYSTKKNGIYTRLKTISKSSSRKYVDKGLASGERYYYTIRAYRTTNGVKTYSNYNTIKSVKVK